METKRSAPWIAGAAWLALISSAEVAWGDPPRSPAADSGPTVVKGVVVTGLPRRKPTDAPPPLEAYATPPKYEHVALSPDGSQVAAVMTVAGVQLLVARQLADDAVRIVRLTGEDVSAISWADKDHVLLTSGRSALRGTCDAGQERSPTSRSPRPTPPCRPTRTPSRRAAGTQGTRGDARADAADARADAVTLGATMQPNACVYYGVREQSAVTSVDMATRGGRIVGLRFGDYSNRPLGTPQRVMIAGKPVLAGRLPGGCAPTPSPTSRKSGSTCGASTRRPSPGGSSTITAAISAARRATSTTGCSTGKAASSRAACTTSTSRSSSSRRGSTARGGRC